jgi:hypothetical protein
MSHRRLLLLDWVCRFLNFKQGGLSFSGGASQSRTKQLGGTAWKLWTGGDCAVTLACFQN